VINDFRTYHNNLYKVGHVFFTEGAFVRFSILFAVIGSSLNFLLVFSMSFEVVWSMCVLSFAVLHFKMSCFM